MNGGYKSGYTKGLDGGYYNGSNGELEAANTRYRQQERLIKAQEKQNELLEKQKFDKMYERYSNGISSDGILFELLGLGDNDCGLFIFTIEFFSILFILPITRQILKWNLGYLNLYAERGETIDYIMAIVIVYIIALIFYILTHINKYINKK